MHYGYLRDRNGSPEPTFRDLVPNNYVLKGSEAKNLSKTVIFDQLYEVHASVVTVVEFQGVADEIP